MISPSKLDTLYPERDKDDVPTTTGVYRRAKVQTREREAEDRHGELAAWRVRLVTDDPTELAISLLGFRSALILRFAAEEAEDGLWNGIQRRYDDAELMASLKAEHEEIIVAAEDLLHRIGRAGTTLGDLEARCRDAFIALVERHEQRERSLIGTPPRSGVRPRR